MNKSILIGISLLSISTFSLAQKTTTKTPVTKNTKSVNTVKPAVNFIEELPPTGYVINTETEPTSGAIIITLANNATVILKPNKQELNKIAIAAVRKGGTSSVKNYKAYISAQQAVNIMNSTGFGDFTKAQLDKALAGTGINIQPFVNEYTSGISGTTPTFNLEHALQLIHLYFTAPVRDETTFEDAKQQLIANAVNKKADAHKAYQDSINYAINNYNERRQPLTEVLLTESLIYDSAYRFYKRQFASAEDFVFTIVGDFNKTTINALLEKYIGSLPTNGKTEVNVDDSVRYINDKIEKTYAFGKGANTIATLVFAGFTNEEYSELDAEKIKIFEKALDNKLNEYLLQKFPSVTNIKTNAALNRFPQTNYKIEISFNAPKADMNTILSKLKDELRQLSESGFSQAALTQATTQVKTAETEAKKTNAYWQNRLQQYLYNKDLYLMSKSKSASSNINKDASKTMVNKYLNFETMAQFVLEPSK